MGGRWRRVPLGLAVVRGRSMEPTLVDGDRLLVRYGAAPRRGRLALVALPDGPDGPRPLSVKRLTRPEPNATWWVESDNTDPALHGRVDSWQVGALPRESVVAMVLVRLPRRGR